MIEMSTELNAALESDESGALDRLIRRRMREDFEALLDLLTMDPSVERQHRVKAIYALGRWGDPAAVAPLRGLLPRLDADERVRAIDSLGRLGTTEALDSVLEYANDESFYVRKFVTRALGRSNTLKARRKLTEIEHSDPADYIRSLAKSLSRK
jgi:HEAT repeat protein